MRYFSSFVLPSFVLIGTIVVGLAAACQTTPAPKPALKASVFQDETSDSETAVEALPPESAVRADAACPQAMPVPTAPCQQCHESELATALPGHETCVDCHSSQAPGTWQALPACGSCHEHERELNPHRELPRNCATCHQAHGPDGLEGPEGPPQPPVCSTCHDPPSLPSLHAREGHTDCRNCHVPHEAAPKTSRADCTSCHEEQLDHQPQAESCASCHLFRPPLEVPAAGQHRRAPAERNAVAP